LRKYRALLWMYKALLVCTYRDLSLPKQRADFCVLICIYRGLLRIYRALFADVQGSFVDVQGSYGMYI